MAQEPTHQTADQAHERVAWVPYASVEQATEVLGAHEGLTYVPFTDNEAPPGPLDEVNLLVLPSGQKPTILDRVDEMGALQVVQAQMAGVDNLVGTVPDGVTLCRARDVHDTATAELALALALGRSRLLDQYARDQVDGRTDPRWAPGLADQRVVLVGYGNIGRAIERRLEPFELASLTRVASHARHDELDGRPVDVHGTDELRDLLPEADVVILVVPLSDDTRGLLDADTLALLPDGAMVVNVGRGPLVDTDALVAECAAGRLVAALDVTDPEPLPEDHPLRTTPGVLVTPHVGGWTKAFEPRRDALLREQVARWVGGEDLVGAVE